MCDWGQARLSRLRTMITMPRVINPAGHTTDQLMIPMLLPRTPRPMITRITPNNSVGSLQPARVTASPPDCGGQSLDAGAGAGALPGGEAGARDALSHFCLGSPHSRLTS